MPISLIPDDGRAVNVGKQNEIINAVNAVQAAVAQVVVWAHGNSTPCTLTVGPGTWLVEASGGAYEVNGVTLQLSIDAVAQASHVGNDDGGLNLCTLGGIDEVVVTDETYDIDVTFSGNGGISFLNARAQRIA